MILALRESNSFPEGFALNYIVLRYMEFKIISLQYFIFFLDCKFKMPLYLAVIINLLITIYYDIVLNI